jgi:hypothetical protein
MARGPIKPKPDVAVSSGIETGLTYEMLKMFKDDSEVQRKKVKEMEYEIQAYREGLNKIIDLYPNTESKAIIALNDMRQAAYDTLNQFKDK